jgi:hypothetical protein
MPKPPPLPHDQALPYTLVGKISGWSSKALHYPVFSPTWFAHRMRGFVFPVSLLTGFILFINFVLPNEDISRNTDLALFFIWASFINSIVVGRWFAVKARSYAKWKSWPAQKEALAIIAALSLAFLISTALIFTSNHYGEKKQLSSTTHTSTTQLKPGIKDQGTAVQRSPANIDTTKENNGDTRTESNKTYQRIVNGSVWLTLTLWLIGIFDLRAYFQQGRAFAQALIEENIARYKKERTLAEMRLSVLASQVEPHFLFNTLSGVRSAMLNDPARGITMIDHLVDYLRLTIPQMRSDGTSNLSSLGNQFDSIRAYLSVIQVRMPRLQFEVECATELRELSVPPLMLISLVENAVKHGIEPKKGQVHISVSAKKIDIEGQEKLQLSVRDNGVGFGGNTSGSGIGLSNICERLKQLYDQDASLVLSAMDEGGVQACIYLPISSLSSAT